ncbi:WavE lipopolysaccharide synthesis family protein [Candidatus Avelusimicrobium caledoniensis]|uniref:WavE lipopolysaccharide synthesis family protein n=1 Tax=Candidatus Avelusimicrobium caledoniensis TaxID=3416220 RepID=UPI003D0DE8EC
MSLPKNTEITVILQGPIIPTITQNAIDATNRALPGARIVLSTWNNEDIRGISCNQIVIGNPPPSVVIHNNPKNPSLNNTNRLIFGMQQVLPQIRTKYVLKLRTDIILQDAEFLKYWDAYQQRVEQYQLFRHRVLNYYLFAPQFNFRQGVKIPTLFHPSDWMFFGFTADIKKLFDIPLQPDPAYSLWWNNHSKPNYQIDPWPGAIFRYSPEQYLFYQALHQKFPEITFDSYFDITREKEQMSRLVMVNNFVVLDYRQWHIKMPKYQHRIGTIPLGQTSHAHWQDDYKTYCDSKFKISLRNIWFKCTKLDIGEIVKAKKIELEKRFVSTFFSSLYKKHLYKKYQCSPAKLKQKLNALSAAKRIYVYAEDVKR